VEKRVLTILANITKVDQTKLNKNSTWAELGLDSLDSVEAIIIIEEEFVIDIQDEVAEKIRGVKDAIDYIITHPFAK